MLARIVLAWMLAVPVLLVAAARATEGTRDYTLTIRMTAGVPGLLQVFADTGRGFSEQQSFVAPLSASPEARDYALRIPPGVYRMFRIDPGTGAGRYTIHRVAVSDSRGATVAAPSLSAIQPLVHLAVLERSEGALVVETPPDPVDPQLLWAPPRPLRLYERRRVLPVAGGLFVMAWGILIGVVALLEALLPRVAPWRQQAGGRVLAAIGQRPGAAIAAVAIVAAIGSAYPVVLMNRSLFSPNNGGNRMLYEQLPFVPESSDVTVEDTRKSDVATATWMFVPFAHVQRTAIAAGELPLWNRFNAGGRPLWGQGYTFLLDPLHWIVLAAPDLAWGLDLKHVAHRTIFAVGVGVVAFAVTGAWLPSALAAASAPFIGLYTYRFNHPQPFALTYAPWILLGWLSLARGGAASSRRGVWLLAASSTLMLYGALPKEAAVMLLSMWGAGALVLLVTCGTWRSRLAGCGLAAAAGLCAVLLTAPHWLVFLDTLRHAETAYDTPYALFGGLPQALAFFLGPVTPGEVLPGFHALALVGVAGAMSAPRRLLQHRAVLVCAVASVALTGVAFGALPERWVTRLPLLGRIGHVHDVFLTAAAPLLLVVCAFGFDRLAHAGVYRACAAAAGTGLAAWALISTSVRLAPPDSFEPFAAFAVLSVAVAASLVFAESCAGRSDARRAACLVAAIILLAPGGLHTDTRWPTLNAVLLQPRPRVPLERSSPAVNEIHRSPEPARTAGIGWTLFPGSQGLYRLEGLSGGGDALQLPLYERLADAAGLWRGWFYFMTLPADRVAHASPFLDLMNVSYVLMPPDTAVPGVVDVRVPPGDRLAVGRRPTAWPRAFFVDGVSRYQGLPEFVAQVHTSRGPIAAVQVGDARAATETSGYGPASGAAVPAAQYVLTTNRTSFRLRAPSRGVAVLTESFLPDDFVVRLNGRPAPYFRVNHAFKGISIPSAGEWQIDVLYRPVHWHVALGMAAAGALLLATLVLSVRTQLPVQ